MNKKRVYLALSALVLLTLSATIVQAALLDPILQPFQRLNIMQTYSTYGFVIDAILIFIILLGATSVGLGERFKDNKSIAVAVGIALSLGYLYWAQVISSPEFRLTAFWPLAVILVLLAIGFAAYNYIKQVSGFQNKAFAMLGFAFLFFYFTSVVPGIKDIFENSGNAYMQLIWAVLNLAAIVCLVWGLLSLFSGLAGLGGGGGGSGGSGAGGSGGSGAGGGGPSRWSRFWDWLDKRKNNNDSKTLPLDYNNPCTVKVKVADLHDNPINGATVTITGVRDKKFKDHEITGTDGYITRDFANVPSGHLSIETRHPNYKFWSMQLGTKKNLRYREIIVQPGETAEVLIRMERVETQGVVRGRIIDEKLAGSIDLKADGAELNDRNKPIGNTDTRRIVVLERIDHGTGVEYHEMGVKETTADAGGFFEIRDLPLGKSFVVGTPVEIPDYGRGYITHLGIVMNNILYKGTLYGRGGRGGKNSPPPTDIIFGRFGGGKNAWEKIKRFTKYYGNEDNAVISMPHPEEIRFCNINGKAVNIYLWLYGIGATRYPDVPSIMGDDKIWPDGPGVENCEVRAAYSIPGEKVILDWKPAENTGVFNVIVPAPAKDVVVQARIIGKERISTHTAWPSEICPAGARQGEFGIILNQPDINDIIVPVFGKTYPDVKVIK